MTDIPVVVRRAETYCASTVHALEQQIQTSDNQLARFRALLQGTTKRREALERICVSFQRFGVLYRKLLGALDHTWPVQRGRIPVPEPVILNIEYLIRDWRRSDETEAMIATVMSSIERLLEGADRRMVALLGAGAGRFAWELAANSDNVIALDLSIPSALSWALLQRGPIELCELQDSNVPTVADLCVPFEATLIRDPSETARLDRLQWVVADGLEVPVADASLSAIVSAYFTDRVSPWRLLTEIHRLLEPGGAFVHFGPFHMAHFDPDESITAEELLAALPSYGFRVTNTEWVEHPLFASRSLGQIRMRAFGCTAIKER